MNISLMNISFFNIYVISYFLVLCNAALSINRSSLNKASNRVINPIQSNERHPWLAFLLNQEKMDGHLQEESKPGSCTGSVISKTSIITAGHCVCPFRKGYIECKKNLDTNTPVNQIIPGRDIYYIVGQKTIDHRLLSNEDYGEVLYSLPKAQKAFTAQKRQFSVPDIGILIVDIENWEIRRTHNIVHAIVLPDEGLGDLHNSHVRIAGWGNRFEFGYHDSKRERIGTFDSPTLHSACKTTEESPVGSRFRSCDTIEIIENARIANQQSIAKYTSCHAEYPLNWEMQQNNGKSKLGSTEKCNVYWNAADKLMLKKMELFSTNDLFLQRVFGKAHRIVVDETHCYRKDLFRNKGWCKITDEVAPVSPGTAAKPSTKWGFCSSSCNIEFMKKPNTPRYLETELRLIERKSDKRKLCKWSKYVINEANLCTLSTFPETETMIFKADPSNPNADKDLPIFLKDDKINDPVVKPDKATEELILENKRGYSDPCTGDSGSPLWSTKEALMNIYGQPEQDRYILVAVYSGFYKTNEYFQPICSSTAGRAVKMTDKVLKWIRKVMLM